MSVTRDQFYQIAGVSQHSEFEKKLAGMVLDKKSREEFYRRLLAIDKDVYADTFRQYFEEYSAERKSNMQDYTPDTISSLLAELTTNDAKDSGPWTAYDPTAGTGSLLIQKWKADMLQESIFSYAPHNYFYRADEIADNSIPYLLHNLAIRGMNCMVIHGDALEGRVKQIYYAENGDDDFMGFSDINVMPHDERVSREFGVTKWLEDEIKHIETEDPKYVAPLLPMKRKGIHIDYSKKAQPHESVYPDLLKLDDVAHVERAKAKKSYPQGTIIIQMSATRGQIGLLKSNGEVGSQYACVESSLEPQFLFEMLKIKSPHHFHRVQQGLNLTLDDIKTIPVVFPYSGDGHD